MNVSKVNTETRVRTHKSNPSTLFSFFFLDLIIFIFPLYTYIFVCLRWTLLKLVSIKPYGLSLPTRAFLRRGGTSSAIVIGQVVTNVASDWLRSNIPRLSPAPIDSHFRFCVSPQNKFPSSLRGAVKIPRDTRIQVKIPICFTLCSLFK